MCNCNNKGWGIFKRSPEATQETKEVEPSLSKRRLSICAECPKVIRLHKGVPIGADIGLADRCAACSCLLRLKVKLADEECKDKKW